MDSRRRRILKILLIALYGIRLQRLENKRERQRECLARRNDARGRSKMLLEELRLKDENSFRIHLRMDEDCFKALLTLIGSSTTHTDASMRQCIPAHKRLSVTLRFLATGESFQSLSQSTGIAQNIIRVIVIEMLTAITNCLVNEYLKIPQSESEWLEIAEQYYDQWDFPNCLGALDAKQIEYKSPQSSASFCMNYKETDSILLLALVTADYKFLAVDIGSTGRISDGGDFGRSFLSNELRTSVLNIPHATPLPGRRLNVPYVIVANDTFPLKSYIMTPHRLSELSNEQKIYNSRVYSAHRTVEHAFGLLSNRFRIFLQPINLNVESVQLVTKVACVLQNFLLTKSTSYLPSVERNVRCKMRKIIRQEGIRPSSAAFAIRNEFQTFFNTSVAGEDHAIENYVS